jgi:hypothetical protein
VLALATAAPDAELLVQPNNLQRILRASSSQIIAVLGGPPEFLDATFFSIDIPNLADLTLRR